MASSYSKVDPSVVEKVGLLSELNAEDYGKVFTLSVAALEGKEVKPELKQLSDALRINHSKLADICSSVSVLMWDCAKLNVKEQEALRQILMHLGLKEELATAFCLVFHSLRRRIALMRGSLGVSSYSYCNLSWRLEVELARRNVRALNEPRYLLRLDLVDHSCSMDKNDDASAPTERDSRRTATPQQLGMQKSHHLQADYATMKMLQNELQKAMDEMNSVHCQRISRYI